MEAIKTASQALESSAAERIRKLLSSLVPVSEEQKVWAHIWPLYNTWLQAEDQLLVDSSSDDVAQQEEERALLELANIILVHSARTVHNL